MLQLAGGCGKVFAAIMSDYTLSALPLGTVLQGRYKIESCLGQGGFAFVYLALDEQSQTHVVIKECVHESYLVRGEDLGVYVIDEQAQEMFEICLQNSLSETAALKALTQAGVRGISDYLDDFAENNTHYIAMSYVKGRSLDVWQARFIETQRTFDGDFLKNLMISVLGVLKGIHEQGYYHCDIKPANIFLDEQGGVTLLDFGAVRTDESVHDENVAISPGFSPAEFYPSHRSKVGPWTDIYMCATMLYEMITHKVPEPADERAVRDRNLRLSSMVQLHQLYPMPLLNSIDKAMNVNPQDRFADAQVWVDFFTNVSTGVQLVRANTTRAGQAQLSMGVLTRGGRTQLGGVHALSGGARHRQHSSSSSGWIWWLLAIIGLGIAAYMLS